MQQERIEILQLFVYSHHEKHFKIYSIIVLLLGSTALPKCSGTGEENRKEQVRQPKG